MANRRRARSRTTRGRQVSQLEVLPVSYDKRNAIIFAIGLLVIAIGYICMAKDPDGNTIEFSYDQGIYATVQEVWG